MLKKVFVNRRVALLWAGQVVSQTGDTVYQMGLLWLMLEMTGRKSLTGLAAAALFVPTLLFGLPAGVMADRVSRRHLMIGADLLRALLVLAIPLAVGTSAFCPGYLALVSFAVASCAAVFYPARDALLPDLVPRKDLPHANALIQTSWQLAILLGPVVAGIMLPLTGIIHLFTFDAVTFLVSLIAIAAIGTGVLPRTPPVAHRRASPAAQLREGFAYIAKDPLMRMLVFITAIDNLILMGPAIVGPPILVREVLQLNDPRAYAWVQASLAGGMLVGAPFMAIFGKRLPLGKTALWGVVLDGLTYAPLFFVNSLRGVMAVIFVHSFFIPLITVSRTTLIQHRVPAELHGRMFAVISVCVVGGTALSAALTGLAAEIIPIQTIYLIIGLGAAATATPGFLLPGLREAGRPI